MSSEKIVLRRGEIDKKVVDGLLSNREYKDTVKSYVNQGMELNTYIRNRWPLSESHSQLQKNIIKYSKKVEEIFKDTDYIKVCRMMYEPYDINLPAHSLSTANICLTGFGSYRSSIYVPKDAYIMIRDITEDLTVKDPHTGKIINAYHKPVFEIVISPATKDGIQQYLIDLDEERDITDKYYVVSSDFSVTNLYFFQDIYKQDTGKKKDNNNSKPFELNDDTIEKIFPKKFTYETFLLVDPFEIFGDVDEFEDDEEEKKSQVNKIIKSLSVEQDQELSDKLESHFVNSHKNIKGFNYHYEKKLRNHVRKLYEDYKKDI